MTVRGPEKIPWQLGATAVECIDDAIALIDDEPVPVDDLWADVLRTVAGEHCDRSVLVCPTWWTVDRVDRVRSAASAALSDVVVLRRGEALAAERDGTAWAVVEIAEELVVISRSNGAPETVVRSDTETVVAAVAAQTAAVCEVVIDAPRDVPEVDALSSAIAERLGRNGIAVSVVNAVSYVVLDRPEPPEPNPARGPRGRVAVSAGFALTAVFAAVAAVFSAAPAVSPAVPATGHRPAPDGAQTTTLIEGRVGMQVPATWTVERLTGGSGSARVQVVSPSEPGVALHLTQSTVPAGRLLDTLHRALGEQPAGVFIDFNPQDRVGGRDVISYRELRAQRHVRWIVLVDKSVRIAIGCQNAPQRAETVQSACEAAVRSAHAIF